METQELEPCYSLYYNHSESEDGDEDPLVPVVITPRTNSGL